MDDYNAANRDDTPLAEAEAMIGKRARLPFTGQIIDAGRTKAGTWVKFKLDERWGFGDRVFGLDPSALELIESNGGS